MKNGNSIAIMGPYPPPFGGVSVHIQRLHRRLKEEGLEVKIYSETPVQVQNPNLSTIRDFKKWFVKYWFSGKEKIFHCHTHSWNRRFFISLLRFRGNKVIFTFHSLRNEWSDFSWTKKLRIKWLLSLAHQIIVVSEAHFHKLKNWGCDPGKIAVINAFIPPLPEEAQGRIPPDLDAFIQEGDKIVVANASKLIKYKKEDLYGIDMIVHLTWKLKAKFKKIRTIICLGKIGDCGYFEYINTLIKTLNIEGNIKIAVGENLPPILARGDLFVRPSTTDGFSVSLLEALSFNKKAIASDACERPPGTILFVSRDIEDLFKKALEVLERNESTVKTRLNVPDACSAIKSMYRNLF